MFWEFWKLEKCCYFSPVMLLDIERKGTSSLHPSFPSSPLYFLPSQPPLPSLSFPFSLPPLLACIPRVRSSSTVVLLITPQPCRYRIDQDLSWTKSFHSEQSKVKLFSPLTWGCCILSTRHKYNVEKSLAIGWEGFLSVAPARILSSLWLISIPLSPLSLTPEVADRFSHR